MNYAPSNHSITSGVTRLISNLQASETLDNINFFIDNYILALFNQPEYDIKEYIGSAWELWANSNQSKLIALLVSEVNSDGFTDDVDKLIAFAQKNNIHGSKISIIASNNVSRDNIMEYIINRLPGVNVSSVNFFEWETVQLYELHKDDIENTLPYEERRRFNMFSRNYKNWRHQFVGTLYTEQLLDNFYFSFYNIDPYNVVNDLPTPYSNSFLKSQLNEIDADLTAKLELTDFYNQLPFRLPADVSDKSTFEIYQNDTVNRVLKSTDISVIIETLFPYGEDAFHCTEKTWKPILFYKPFIIFGSHLYLKNLRKMGYCTFDPYIDETYDTIEDPKERSAAIVKEIKRISELDSEEFAKLMEGCLERTRWNHSRIMRRRDFFYHGVQIDPTLDCVLNYRKK